MGQLHASKQKATERAQDVANKTEAKAQELYEQGQIKAESLTQHLSQNAADMYNKSKNEEILSVTLDKNLCSKQQNHML